MDWRNIVLIRMLAHNVQFRVIGIRNCVQWRMHHSGSVVHIRTVPHSVCYRVHVHVHVRVHTHVHIHVHAHAHLVVVTVGKGHGHCIAKLRHGIINIGVLITNRLERV